MTEKRQWQTGGTLRLSTIHPLLKEPREYVFMELNQEYGSRIFWKYVLVIIRQWPKVKGSVSGVIKKLKEFREAHGSDLSKWPIEEALSSLSSVMDTLIDIIPELFDWSAISEMSELLLADHMATIEGKELTADAKGFCGAHGDPTEVFVALFFSMCVNWPKYFSPLLGMALEDLTRDSGPTQTQSESAKSTTNN